VSQADTTQPKQPLVALFRAANPVIRPLLASPLHRVLSKRLMLLTYTGRKSGRRITIPIGYFEWEPNVVLAASSHFGWIPNLRTGPTVQLRIRGRRRHARLSARALGPVTRGVA